MRIKINISNETCEDLLKHYGYTSEKLLLYYNIYSEYEVEPSDENLRAVESTIAYPLSERPEVLNSERPMVDDCREFMYDTVVERLFNKRLLEVMFDSKGRRPHIEESQIHYK